MEVVTAAEMRAIDREAIEVLGIPGPVLMENAGRSVVEHLKRRFDDLETRQVVILCGKGNNGGDGFVVSRWLNGMGVPTKTILLGSKDEVKGDAKLNLEILSGLGIPVDTAPDQAVFRRFADVLFSCDIIVDAMLGTGLTQGASGIIAEVIEMVNSVPAYVVSVDTPSGLSSDTPEILGNVVRAAATITFGLPKVGQLLYPGAEFVGELVVADIGIPPEIVARSDVKTFRMDPDELDLRIFLRSPDAHKGTFGHVLIVGGSTGKTGAVALASAAAMRAGAGLCTAAIPASLNEIMEVKITEAMTVPLPEDHPGAISDAAVDLVLRAIEELRISAVAVGPGLGTAPETVEFVRELLPRIGDVPIVLDADGINALAGSASLLDKLESPIILTPHPKEFSRVSGVAMPEISKDRLGTARKFAESTGAFVVLKGARTIVTAPDGTAFINMTGNPGMASGGTGDVLTGLIAAFAAQGAAPLEAAKLGVYLHGLAGDIAARTVGEASLVASDLLDFLPEAIAETVT